MWWEILENGEEIFLPLDRWSRSLWQIFWDLGFRGGSIIALASFTDPHL